MSLLLCCSTIGATVKGFFVLGLSTVIVELPELEMLDPNTLSIKKASRYVSLTLASERAP
jgi:hypothetical protein